MPLESYSVLLRNAQKKNYAIGAFNIFALEFLPSILQAAQEEHAPAILQINPVHFHLANLPDYIDYVKSQIAKISVPIGLNLDHGPNKSVILQGIEAGFPSVMFDGSKLSYQENIAHTREIRELCQKFGITLEAELGMLNDEGSDLTEDMKTKLFTSPDNAAEFVAETAIDGLAIAIGNAHGFYKGNPQLDFKRLQAIRDRVNVPLVLHGGSGISDSDFKQAIGLGICKINIYTEMSAAAANSMKELLCHEEKLVDYPTSLYQARLAVKEVVKQRMKVFGSSGRA